MKTELDSKKNPATDWPLETAGRKYVLTCYAVLSRTIGGDGKWYGFFNYPTLDEATAELHRSLKNSRCEKVGGILLSYSGGTGKQYEHKLVKIVKHCEVLEAEIAAA